MAQLFIQGGWRRIVGALGALQFEIIQHRLVHEYGAACRMETLPYARAFWINSRDPAAMACFRRFNESDIATDKDGNPGRPARVAGRSGELKPEHRCSSPTRWLPVQRAGDGDERIELSTEGRVAIVPLVPVCHR